ncbi:sigma factor, partial [Phenylobacterium sp.]|uniref:sigma factor n=1 Tax=Phenylobacterium sp. TaxID=1871053 RepID=UPI00286E3E93
MPGPRAFADLHAQARRHARRPDEADDLLQAALLAALESGRTDLAAAETRRWIVGVIRNRAAFDARTSARRKRRDSAWSDMHGMEPAHPEQRSQEASGEKRTGEATLPTLSPSLRLTALLALSGHTRQEIGWLLNLSDTALRQRISQL